MTQSIPSSKFLDGNTIDQLGFGVWQVADEEAEVAVGKALKAGYRHIDTAKIYGNEAGVGRAVAASSIAREELFITTKVWNADQGYDKTIAAADASLERLGLEYVDLYLIHWLQPKRGTYVDTWKALIQLQKDGKAKSIGVCNFTKEALEELYTETGVRPVINQVETHPYFPQAELRAYEAEHGILHQAWSPLGQGGDLLKEPLLAEIAKKHEATVAQVVIAWHLALGNVVIPKSVTDSRIVENFESLNVKLDAEDIEAIATLDRGAEGRIAADPATADFE
ncbi:MULTISPECIES: aldo/keto reductase [Micrococcaceae]|uniref:aldo/keto reductase n=1 Tax=Micrococcaceae TaxID=1268 RepID=UPI0010366CEB|nr:MULTISPECIES: aldo/keto reductase [Micrococcaceae]TAP24997.1 aldo/keto reductase [Arthrobacter sp. S41]UXN31982.1 aldo/keto reductase [Glutamicibacter sp. M10]